MSISLVIPVYKSKGILQDLYRRILASLTPLGASFEIIMVEDGGRDGAWEIIENLARSDPKVRGIKLSRNYGQHNALLCGIRAAKNKIVVTLDDDLQHPPEEIPKLLKKLEEGYDVVYGVPEKDQHGLWRNLSSQITKLVLQNAMGAEVARQICAFRAFRTSLCEAFSQYHSPFLSLDVLLTWGSASFSAIPVHHKSRHSGKSHYSFCPAFLITGLFRGENKQ